MTNKRAISILIVRDLVCLHQAWHGAYGFLSFHNKQRSKESVSAPKEIFGVFVNKFLLPPDKLPWINSFGLSGVWSLCEIDPNLEEIINRSQQLEWLIKVLVKDKPAAVDNKTNACQIFIPVLNRNNADSDILKWRDLDRKYFNQIKQFIVLDSETGEFVLKNYDNSAA